MKAGNEFGTQVPCAIHCTKKQTKTQEVSAAVIASTLTSVAVFLPIVFVEGVAGQLFRDQALTVTFSLLASLLVAVTLIPMLAAAGSSTTSLRKDPVKPGSDSLADVQALGWFSRLYGKLLGVSLAVPLITLLLGFGLLSL